MQPRKLRLALAVSAATVTLAGVSVTHLASAQGPSAADAVAERMALRQLPGSLGQNRLEQPATAQADAAAIIDPALLTASGTQQVIIRLKGNPVARHFDQSPSGRISHKQKVKFDQDKFLKRASRMAPGSKEVARTQVVINAVFMDVDAAKIKELANDPDVYSIHRVRDYEMHLSETVPYIGADVIQDLGVDGSGVKVAVLDSGIDYTHAALGGGGTLADYQAAYGTDTLDPANTTRDGLFPTARVVEGYDFVGELWPGGPLAPDEDPIDFEGHGTHVADIIGGNLGVAPGVDLFAVKVCSAVSSSCSGVALIQGMEFAVDPNGDGDISDGVDIINMSLGSSYGQAFDDDLAVAVDNASALGVLTVASAGNSGDKPYANGTPASAATALSVAQTQVPSAVQPFLTLNGQDYPAVFQPWSVAPVAVVSGQLVYGDGAGGNLNGCAPFAPGSLAGLAVLVDRGACNFSLKISNISQAGGVLGVIGLVAPGDPFSGGDGGDRPIDIPGYMVSQSISNTFKAAAGTGAELSVDPAKGVSLAGQMVGSSARGPQHEVTNLLKPEIGAPGASVSAIAGSGTGTGPFGGTSGAAPMVAGSAALLLQSEPGLSPAEAKARLMNTGFTDVLTDPISGLAPISRIGGGEVRADKALGIPVSAWDADTLQGGLSFGFVDVDKDVVNLHKTVKIHNYSSETRDYTVTPTFRYDEDADSGAVSVDVPSGMVRVGGGKTATVRVNMTVNGSLLPDNAMDSGSGGANPAALTASEFDGYLLFDDGRDPIQMPWHVLPRKSANVSGRTRLQFKNGFDEVSLNNLGVGTAQNDAYSLIAVSDNQPEGGLGEQSPTPDIRAVGVSTIPVPAGFCSGSPSFLWNFAINTWERQQHLLPVSHLVFLDTDQDGIDDYVILNRDLSGPTTITDGRQVSWVQNLATGSLSAFFFAEHATNSGNTVLRVCGEQIGMNADNLGNTPVNVDVIAQDFYFGGPGDEVTGLTLNPGTERYIGMPEDIPGQSTGTLEVYDFGAYPGNSEEYGVMLLTNGDRGPGRRGGATEATEALLLTDK